MYSRYVLESEHMKKFFDYIQLPNFDISSDAAATFKVEYSLEVTNYVIHYSTAPFQHVDWSSLWYIIYSLVEQTWVGWLSFFISVSVNIFPLFRLIKLWMHVKHPEIMVFKHCFLTYAGSDFIFQPVWKRDVCQSKLATEEVWETHLLAMYIGIDGKGLCSIKDRGNQTTDLFSKWDVHLWITFEEYSFLKMELVFCMPHLWYCLKNGRSARFKLFVWWCLFI